MHILGSRIVCNKCEEVLLLLKNVVATQRKMEMKWGLNLMGYVVTFLLLCAMFVCALIFHYIVLLEDD